MALKKKTTLKKTATSFQVPAAPAAAGPGWAFILFGTLFGYFLSKARATDYDTIVDMFLMKDFQLYGVIGTAILVTSFGLYQIRRNNLPPRDEQAVKLETMVWEPKRLSGAFLFGAGWAAAGTCPGTALTQIGEGKLVAFVTVLGILAGVWFYSKVKPMPKANDHVC